MDYEGKPLESMEIGGGRRLAVAADALSVEVRGGGRWIRSRVVPYEDIRAIYRFEKLDTSTLAALGGLWLALLVLVLIGGASARWNGTTNGLAVLLLSVGLGGFAVYRARMVPARLLRIEAYSGVLIVPDRSAAFFQSVAARIRVPEAAPASVPTQYPGYGETPISAPENSDPA